MVKKPLAGQKKQPRQEGAGILHYFDPRRPVQDKDCQPPAADLAPCSHPITVRDTPEVNGPAAMLCPGPPHRQLSRLQEPESLAAIPLSQDNENVVVWNSGSPILEHHREPRRSGSPPASRRRMIGTNDASKQRFLLRQQAAPAQLPPIDDSCEELLAGILEGLGGGAPLRSTQSSSPHGGGLAAAQLDTPRAAAPLQSAMKAPPHSRVKKDVTPGSVSFRELPRRTSSKGANVNSTAGPVERSKKRTRVLLLETINALQTSLSSGITIMLPECFSEGQNTDSPVQPPSAQRSRLGSDGTAGGRVNQHKRNTWNHVGAPQPMEPVMEGIKPELEKLLVGCAPETLGDTRGQAGDCIRGGSRCAWPGEGDANGCAKGKESSQIQLDFAPGACGTAAGTTCTAGTLDDGQTQPRTVECVQRAPRSPYDAETGAPPSQIRISQPDLAKSILFDGAENTSGGPTSPAKPRVHGAANMMDVWGDGDDEDDENYLEVLDDMEAAALSEKCRDHRAGPPETEGMAPTAAPVAEVVHPDPGGIEFRRVEVGTKEDEEKKLKVYAGDRAVVHFRVDAVWRMESETQLQLYNPYSKLEVIAHLRSPWSDGDFRIGDPVNIVVNTFDRFEGRLHCILGLEYPGIIVHFPDTLLGGTRIAASGECIRKGYLAERVASEGTNAACVKGTLYHSLFQSTLASNIRRGDQLRAVANDIAHSRPSDLLDSNMSEEEAMAWLTESTAWTLSWVAKYLRPAPTQNARIAKGPMDMLDGSGAPMTRGTAVSEVVDIEEYIAAPKFGLKGLVDVSVQLTLAQDVISSMTTTTTTTTKGEVVIAPLELKTGKKRDSDAAQVLLYLLQMEERYGHPLQWGLLVHKGQAAPQLIQRDDASLACLMATRNLLAAAIARAEAPPLTGMKKSCEYCFERTACMLSHAAAGGDLASFLGDLPEGQLRAKLTAAYETEAGHLTSQDAAFLSKWDRLLELESSASQKHRPEIWSMTGEERQALGRCVSDLVITRIDAAGEGGWLYTFERPPPPDGATTTSSSTSSAPHEIECGFPPGEMLMLSIDGKHAGLGRGHLYSVSSKEIVVHVDRRIRQGMLQPNGMSPDGAGTTTTTNNNKNKNNSVVSACPAPDRGQGKRDPPPGVGVRVEVEAGAGAVSDVSVRWRLDKEEIGTTATRLRGFLYSMFAHHVDSDGAEDAQSAQASRLRSLIVDLSPPRPPKEMKHMSSRAASAVQKQAASFGLNAEQTEAVCRAVTAEDYTLVLGMPGAGKTTAVVAMIKALASIGKRVLLTSYTNSAVDNVLLKLADSGNDVPFVRVGREGRVHPGLLPWLPGGVRHRATTSAALARLADSVPVLGVSALGCTDPLVRRRQFDVCIVDEAGQITLPATLGPLLRSRAFVLVGDHHQLPPLVTSKAAAEGGLDTPLFAQLATAHPEAVVCLPVQYRMAEDIQVLPNLLAYDGRLRCASESVAQAQLVARPQDGAAAAADGPSVSGPAKVFASEAEWVRAVLDPGRRVVFVDTCSAEGGREVVAGEGVSNPGEVVAALTVLRAAAAAGVPQGALATISPYNRQVALLERALKESGLGGVESLTIDRAQGRDKECVVISFVRSNAEGSAGKLLKDYRRVNVAITRAKSKLVLIGDSKTLRSLDLFDRLLGECETRGWTMKLPEDGLV